MLNLLRLFLIRLEGLYSIVTRRWSFLYFEKCGSAFYIVRKIEIEKKMYIYIQTISQDQKIRPGLSVA